MNKMLRVAVGGWCDVSTASYDSVSFSVAGQNSTPKGLTFKPDGTKMYMVGRIGNSAYQYSLSTAWDLDTAAYDSVNVSVPNSPTSVVFKPDGTKMYVSSSSSDSVYQYSLSTAWDLDTAAYDSVSFDAGSEEVLVSAVVFKQDGTKMYIMGYASDSVHQYSLSTAWDLDTAAYDSVSFDVSEQDGGPRGLTFKPDGTKMYMVGTQNDSVHQYSLSTAWDLDTAAYDSVSFDVSEQDASPYGIAFKNNGRKMYIMGENNNTLYQYSLC